MKKFIKPLCFVLAAVIIIIIFKIAYKDKTYDYKVVIDYTFNRFYITGDPADLGKALDLLNAVKKNEDMVMNIQAYSRETVDSWVSYLKNKYVCDLHSVNACRNQYSELDTLLATERTPNKVSKLDVLHEFKNENGDSLLSSYDYGNFVNEITKLKTNIMDICNSPSATYPISETTKANNICRGLSKEKDCSCSYNNTCSCEYNEEGKNKTIVCPASKLNN